MKKTELRKKYLEKRSLLDELEVTDFSDNIIDRFLDSELADVASIHLFLPIDKFNEVNIWPLIEVCWQEKVKVYCPRVEGDELLHFRLTDNTDLEFSAWDILEPAKTEKPISDKELQSIELILIPLLAVDEDGNRIGYGKGYYDRFLAKVPKAKKVGVSLFTPVESIDDLSDNDIPLDYLVTPYEIIVWERS